MNEPTESNDNPPPQKRTRAEDGTTQEDHSTVGKEAIQAAHEVLKAIVQDRSLLLALPKAEMEEFLKAAGLVAHPGRAAKRKLVKALRSQRRGDKLREKSRDESLLAQTQIRSASLSNRSIKLAAPPEPMPECFPTDIPLEDDHFLGELESPRNCYICKSDYRLVHQFYDSLCPNCAQFNWQKRNQTADLSGRVALVTGGRVKIGFEAVLKLLRAGAYVVVTTRFPADAARRFADQRDYSDWTSRLQIHGLDMRHIPSVETLANHLGESLPRLDFILNNACQTVRRPPGFYKHLIHVERQLHQGTLCEHPSLQAHLRLLKDTPEFGEAALATRNASTEASSAGSAASSYLAGMSTQLAGILDPASLTQVRLLAGDEAGELAFPRGQYDQDQQQLDLRGKNSWRLKLAEVSTVELLEVHLVNAVAPYILNARLKGLMNKMPSHDKHIVNVSAMEGVFYRAFKRDTHPHTNMAKAALNMMTRTSAADYIRDGIHMNSVDTGWITDEDPIEITKRKQTERGFTTPLDTIDAAARICDPIFHGIRTGEHVWGKFLKDYQVSNW